MEEDRYIIDYFHGNDTFTFRMTWNVGLCCGIRIGEECRRWAGRRTEVTSVCIEMIRSAVQRKDLTGAHAKLK